MRIMGNSCGAKTTTAEVVLDPKANSKPQIVPYIVVSSVSLSRKIADENLCASVTNTPRTNRRDSEKETRRNRPSKYRRRRRSSVTPSPEPSKSTTDTIVFQDQEQKHRMEVEITSRDDVPYLTLQPTSSQTQDLLSLPPRSRVPSLVSLSASADDVSLTSELLRPESSQRPTSATRCCDRGVTHSQLSLPSQSRWQTRRRSESAFMNRLQRSSSLGGSEGDDNDCWETASMKQQLEMTKSISAIDLIQQFKEEGVLDKDFANDNEVWQWFESHTDSGRSSPIDQDVLNTSPEEQIMAKLDLLSLYAPMKGPTMRSRVSAIANEIVVLYERLTGSRLHVERSVTELISSVDAIRSPKDIQYYVYCAR